MSSTLDLDRRNVVDIDLGSAEFKANAHRHMAEWARRPPFYVLGQGQPQVVVGRYADVHKVFSDTQTFASEMPRGPGWEQFNKIMDAQFVTQMDGEQHARVRRLLMPAFSSRRIEQFKESITAIVDGMLDRIEANGPAFDGMQDYGAHLVVDALLTAMVAMDERRKAVFTAFHDLIPGTTYVKPGESWSPELRSAFDRTMAEIRVIIDERRASPRPDFISDLVNARDAGDKLNDRELFDQIFGICGASLSATSRAAGGALYLLYTHDDQRQQLIDEPVAHSGSHRRVPAAGQQRLFHLSAHRHRATRTSAAPASSRAWWCGRRRSRRTTTRTSFPIPCASTSTANRSASCRSAPARTTASATSWGAPRSPSRSRGCWRDFRRRISAIRISQPVYGGAVGELRLQSLPMRTQ